MRDLALREKFLSLKIQKKTHLEIAASLGVSVRTIERWNNLFKSNELMRSKPIPGRPRKASDRTMRLLAREAKKNGVRSVAEITQAAGAELHEETTAKYLKEMGITYRTRPLVPLLLPRHKKNRKSWAQARQDLDESYWRRVVWTDETTVCINGGYGPRKSWTTKELLFEGNNPRFRRQNGGGKVMFWGCFTSDGVGLLIPIEGNMNSQKYVEMLEMHVLPWIRQREEDLGVKLIFQQDNAPCHVSRKSREFLASNNIEVLEWPPCSPDLSPIENLWSILKMRIVKNVTMVRTLEDLKRTAKEIWEKLTPPECLNHALSVPKRLKKVIERNGGHIGC